MKARIKNNASVIVILNLKKKNKYKTGGKSQMESHQIKSAMKDGMNE